MRWLRALIVLAVACGTATPATTLPATTTTTIPPPTVFGGLELGLSDAVVQFVGQPPDVRRVCEGRGQFAPGGEVVVKNAEDGTIIGVGRLEGEGKVLSVAGEDTCLVAFTVPLIREAPFYTVEIVGREGPLYTHDEMVEAGWLLALSLAD